MAGLPIEPVPRDPAAREAASELSKKIYTDQRPSPLNRAVDWVLTQVRDFLDQASSHGPGGGLGLLLVLVIVLAVIALLIWRFGLPGRSARTRPVTEIVTPTHSALEHEQRADAYAAEGRWAEAVRERLRALVAGLVARDLVDNRPGRTATEVAAEASQALPAAAGDLSAAVRIFADVWYGGRAANAEHDRQMRTILSRVGAAEPAQAGAQPDAAWVLPGAGATPAGREPR